MAKKADKPKPFPAIPAFPGRIGIALGVLGLGAFLLASRFPDRADLIYGRAIYPRLVRELAALFAIFPFSVAEWVFLLVVLSVLTAAPRGYRYMRRDGGRRARSFLSAATHLAGAVGMWWFWFLLLWGLNYTRPFPAIQFGLQAPVKAAQKADIISGIVARLDQVRALAPEEADGVAQTPGDRRELDAHLRKLQAAALGDAGFPPVDRGRVKTLLGSPLLLRWGVSGVYGPFTGEPNIVWPAPPALLPFTMAHERAHLSGFAREDAASFVALLTCWRSERPAVRYSAWLALYLQLRLDPAERAAGVQRDVAAVSEFVKRHRGREAPLVWNAYGEYLKAHGIKEGVASYRGVADLALRWLARTGLPPEPAGPPAVGGADRGDVNPRTATGSRGPRGDP